MNLRDFKTIWVVDFEFRAAPGERPEPVCLVAHEVIGGAEIRMWADELATSGCPYDLGPDALFVAYYASAEMGCHLALGWPMPVNILDLYAEFRVETNGKHLVCGRGLLGALSFYGEKGVEALEKDQMRELILRGRDYSAGEKQAIFCYCESDVVATKTLLSKIWGSLDDLVRLDLALVRGNYSKAVSKMEWEGVPIDTELLRRLRQDWETLKVKMIAQVDQKYGVYEGKTFKQARFSDYLNQHNIPWPVLDSGRLALDDDTFSEQCKSWPQLRPLKDLRQALGQLRLNDLAVGADGRNRTLLAMFSSKTGRNQPSNAKFVFGLSAWLRGLIKPSPGCGLAYIDWSQQEFGIAAALSGDCLMQEAYLSGDPYLTFAKQAGAAPADATKVTHAAIRQQYKACVLAVQYGMQEESLGRRIQQPAVYARELLKMHRRTYATFWLWSDAVLNYALTHRRLWTVLGWQIHVEGSVNGRSLRNYPMQANGAEMLRLACCFGAESGIRIVAPVHDAVLIEAPLDELSNSVEKMQECMNEASAMVLSGFKLRSDAKLIPAPQRFVDERGIAMWEIVQGLLGDTDAGDAA